MTAAWSTSDAIRDTSDQTEQMNADWRDEYATDRNDAFIPDDPRRPDEFDEDEGRPWSREKWMETGNGYY